MSESPNTLPAVVPAGPPQVPAHGTGGAVAPWVGNGPARLYWTSLDLTTERGQAQASKCRNEADARVDQLKGEPWPTVDYFAHQVEVCNETTGEVQSCLRLVLIDPEGRTLAMVSAVAIDGFGFLLSMLGPPPWAQPRLLRIEPYRTRRQRNAYRLELVPSPAQVVNGKAKR